jgi:DNA-binding winged helix-turn-helix (wHTH) protein/TolB-like protein
VTTDARVQFGPFVFDPATGELWRDGRRVRLQRQPSRLLELLLARPSDIVTRDEIRKALWGDDTHVDFERSLNFCVAKLRSALRDDAASPQYVETLPTRGYRFVAQVQSTSALRADAAAPVDDTLVDAAVRATTPPEREWRWTAAAIAAVVAAAAAILLAMTLSGSPAAPVVVVVPFHNETGSPDLDRVAKDVSDATVARLATPDRLPRLKVIGNASNLVFSFKPPDMKVMGQSLNAQFLVLGQMKKDDRRKWIVAHLIRVSDQTHVWAHTYESETFDLDAQSRIAEAIATAVVATLGKA